MKKNYIKHAFLIVPLFIIQIIVSAQALPWVWVNQTYNGSNANAQGIAVDNANQVLYVAGFYSTGPIDFGQGGISGSGNQDLFLAKYTLTGTLLWAKTMGNQNNSLHDAVGGLIVDPSGNVYMAGTTSYDSIRFGGTLLLDTTIGSSLGFLAKFDNNGNPLWATAGVPGNSSSLSMVNALITDAGGNIYTTGYMVGTCNFGGHVLTVPVGDLGSMFEVKYNSSGTVLWTQTAPGYNDGWPTPNAITLDKHGNSIVAGNYGGTQATFGATTITNTNANFDDRFVTKLDTAGNFVWAETAGYWQGPDINDAVGVDSQNNVYLAGSTSDPIYGPNTDSYYTAYFIEKLDENGDSLSYLMDTFTFLNYLSNLPFAVFDGNGNCYMGLTTPDTTWTFGSVTGGVHYPYNAVLQTEAQGYVALVVKFNNEGAALWAQNTAPVGQGFIYENTAEVGALDNNGNFYVSGFFSDTTAFGSHIISNTQNEDFYLAKLGFGAAGIREVAAQDMDYTLYPNPNSGQFQLHFTGGVDKVEIRVYDMQGNLLDYVESGSAGQVMLNEQGRLAQGAYLCRVTTYATGAALPTESAQVIVIQ